MSEKELLKSVLYYVLVVKGKTPARKSDIIKLAMNKQGKDFQSVITQVEKHLRKTFGMQLIGMKNGPGDGLPVKCGILEATSYIVVNKIRQEILAMVTPNQTFPNDLIKAVLFLILTSSYMLDRTLDEDTIWSMMTTMEFTQPFCKKREDLKRILKTEFVDPMYLTKYQIKETDQSDRYGWGLRADIEISKFVILKFVAQTVGKRPEDFVTHISKISQEEIRRINEEDELLKRRMRDSDSPSNQSIMEDIDDYVVHSLASAI